MRKSGWLSVAALVASAGFVMSCGSDSPASNTGTVDKGAWAYPEHQFVIDELVLPATSQDAKDLAFDLDGNGTVDNQLGNILAALGPQMGSTSPQTSVDDAMKAGSIIVLMALYAQDIQASASSNMWAFLGVGQTLTAGPQPGGTFTVDAANSPAAAYFGGKIKNGGGAYGGSAAALTLNIPLAAAGQTGSLNLALQAVHVEFDVSADGKSLENGRIGGAISESDLNTKILPEVQVLLQQQIEAKCTLAGATCTCEAGSGAATIQSMFDTNSDCSIDLAEVQNNSLLKAFLKGDVTLANGEKGLSMAVGFHAVDALFTHADPPK
ncbi:MAG TPA: hypothetical protein VGQ83_41775 [Polyangia bacterium]|jgi:hypothetical protein